MFKTVLLMLLLVNCSISKDNFDDNPKGDDESRNFSNIIQSNNSNNKTRDDKTSYGVKSIFDTFIYTGITFGVMIFE